MNYTITISEATFGALNDAAQARGISLDEMLGALAQDVLNQRTKTNK